LIMKLIYKKYLTTVALIWAGSFVLLVLIYMLALAPQVKSKKVIKSQLNEKRQQYENALQATQEQTKKQLKEQIQKLQQDLDNFALPSEASADLIFDISQIAGENNVTSFSIKTSSGRKSEEIPNCEQIGEYLIEADFESGFNQFASLLNTLERHRPVIFVNTFSILRSEDDQQRNQVKMKLAVFVKKRRDS
jgi:hypothetical protein